MAKIIRIRLYRVQDYDLYALYYDKKHYRLSKMCLAAVSAFANGRPLPSFSMKDVQSLPKPVRADNGDIIRSSGVKFTLVMSFSIPDYDTKTIALMECLMKDNTANSFVKTLVRRCFTDMEYMYLDADHRTIFPDPGNTKELVAVYPSDNRAQKAKPRCSPVKKKPHVENKSQPAYETPGREPADDMPVPPQAAAQPSSEYSSTEHSEKENESGRPDEQNTPKDTRREQPRSGLFSMIHEFEM